MKHADVPSLVIYEEEPCTTYEVLVDRLTKSGIAAFEDKEAARKAVDELLEVQVQITHPRAAFVGLRDLHASYERSDDDDSEDEVDPQDGSVALFRRTGKYCKVPRLVGAGRLPKSGLVFEVLPKVARARVESAEARAEARKSLRRMWSFAADLQTRDDQQAAAIGAVNDVPLHEWLVRRFLTQVQDLLARGIRMQYVEREDNLGTVRGRVLPLDNIRQNAFAPHRQYCRFEEFSPDRPENRLIRSALAALVRGCSDSVNRHRASMLAERLHEIPPSLDVRADLARWRDDRLMKHYRELRSTCRWILLRQGISPVRGGEGMVGCFARMNDVFERYVARWIARELGRHDELKHLRLVDQTQLEHHSALLRKNLWRWENAANWTEMRPDMAIYDGQGCVAVLDAKWKLPKTKDIDRSDIYQVHAYARYWLRTGGQVALIYPHLNDDDPVAQRAFRFYDLSEHFGQKLFFKLPTDEGGGGEEGLGLLEPLRMFVRAGAADVSSQPRLPSPDDVIRFSAAPPPFSTPDASSNAQVASSTRPHA